MATRKWLRLFVVPALLACACSGNSNTPASDDPDADTNADPDADPDTDTADRLLRRRGGHRRLRRDR